MSWRFHQSFSVIPGLRLNLSQNGLSASIGGAPFTMNIGPHGLTGTVSLPGTGISYRHHFDSSSSIPSPTPLYPSSHHQPFSDTAVVEQIHSASTELLTSESLKEVKRLIQDAHRQFEGVTGDLDSARSAKVEAQSRYESWDSGFLFKRIFKKAFSKRREIIELETARVAELEEQQRLSKIKAEIDLDKEQADLYYRMHDAFASLCGCAAIWDIKSHRSTDKFHERTTANLRVERKRVTFALGKCDLIEWDRTVPHMPNAKGGDFYLYPGFILYRAAREAFSLIEYHDVIGKAVMMAFQEEDGVPSDSTVIGETWAKANKDGSRDRRFADNYQIPIVQYGQVTLRSGNGLWEELQFSNPQLLLNFLKSLDFFTSSFAAVPK